MQIVCAIDAVDEIQRIALVAFPDPAGSPIGFPNIPIWANDAGEVVDFAEATHALWDGRFTAASARLIAAISADPSKIPADVTGLDRDAVLALYADEMAALEAAEAAAIAAPAAIGVV